MKSGVRKTSSTLAHFLVADERHGPLPVLLLALTVVTGLVDAVSILSLGRVFVANMTGNVVFIGFALAGAHGFSLTASLCALAGFLLGARLGGVVAHRRAAHRAEMLFAGVKIEFGFVVIGLVLVAVGSVPLTSGLQDGAAGAIAIALGLQNAVVRQLAVPDLTTTVLTLTLTGLAVDERGPLAASTVRRSLAVVTMFFGAVIGALLVLHVSPAAALGAAVAVLFGVAVALNALRRGDRPWHAP